MNRSYLLLILLAVLAIGSCKKDEPESPAGPTPPYYPNGIGEIGTIGGTVAMDDENSPFFGAKVIIPEGALSAPVTIEIKLAEEDIEFPDDTTAKIFKFLPDGLEFTKDVTLVLPYVGDTSRVAIHEIVPEDQEIILVRSQSIDVEKQWVSARTSHFSFYTAFKTVTVVQMETFKTDNDKIACTFDANGYAGNPNEPQKNWSNISLRLASQLQGNLNAWDVLQNYNLPVISRFKIELIEHSGDNHNPVQEKRLSIWRNNPNQFKAEFRDSWDETPPFYTSGILEINDYTENLDNGVKWFTGEPIVAIFEDFDPDPNLEYYVQVSWDLTTPISLFGHTFTYTFHNYKGRKNISNLELRQRVGFDSNPADQILDEFQNGPGGSADGPPVVDFEYSPANPNVLDEVQFTNLTQNGVNYTWLFGDGTTVYNEENPTHTYTSSGSYDVVLTAGNSFGENQIVKTINIQESGEDADYPPGTVHCIEGGTEVVEVINPETGRTWMDRNLGASQAANAIDDELAYGDLYQWGRFSDGHQCRDSEETSTVSSSNHPGHSDFILVTDWPYDWRSPSSNNLWQGVSGLNNPCPQSFRVPTEQEWDTERMSWSENSIDGAFNSALKIPGGGLRMADSGSIINSSNGGVYWSSTTENMRSIRIDISGDSMLSDDARAQGMMIRCIKD